MKSLEPLLQEIQGQLEREGSWRLSVDRIPDLLELDHAEFYQRIYAAANRSEGTVDHSTLTQMFEQESVGELVDLLELWAGARAEQALAELGAFIPHPLRVELISLLFEAGGQEGREHREARAHSVDEEVFRAMLDRLGSYESARDAYFGEYFSRDRMIHVAAERFVRERSFRAPNLALHSAVGVLTRMFRSHILELQTVLVSVGLALFDIAVEAGYARSYEEEAAAEWNARGGWTRDGERGGGNGSEGWTRAGGRAGGNARAGGRGGDRRAGGRTGGDRRAGGSGWSGGWSSSREDRSDDEVQRRVSWACGVLELRPENTDHPTIKRAYKKLMLRYHPDVNPRGLHKAKQINRAYSVLLTSAPERSADR